MRQSRRHAPTLVFPGFLGQVSHHKHSKQGQGCANMATKTGLVWALSAHRVLPWCQPGLAEGAQVALELRRWCLAQVTAASLMGGGGEVSGGHRGHCCQDLSAYLPALLELSHVGKPPGPSLSHQQLPTPDWTAIKEMS